jgi:hypothetical protein
MPRCGAGLVPAGHRREAAAGRRRWVLLDVALPGLLPHTHSIYPPVTPPKRTGHLRFPLFKSMQAPLKEIEGFPPARVVALLNIHLPCLRVSRKESKARLTFQRHMMRT